jgi:hypothetical protein
LLGAFFKAKSIWDDIIKKIKRWLAVWKMMYLSKGRKITLIMGTFSWRNIWQNKVPLSVVLFAWLAELWTILVMDNIRKQHIIVIDWCCMC